MFASLPPKFEVTVTEKDADSDLENADLREHESLGRPLVFMSAIFVGLAVALIMILLLGFGVSQVSCRLFLSEETLRVAVDLSVARGWTMDSLGIGSYITAREWIRVIC